MCVSPGSYSGTEEGLLNTGRELQKSLDAQTMLTQMGGVKN